MPRKPQENFIGKNNCIKVKSEQNIGKQQSDFIP